MRKIVFVAVVAGGTAGAGVGLWQGSGTPQPDPVASIPSKAAAAASLSGLELEQLKARVDALEARLKQVADRPRGDKVKRPWGGRVAAQAESGTTKADEMRPISKTSPSVEAIVDELEQDESVIRRAVSGIVRDQMQNRMEEWRAFRAARGEARDEERVDRLGEKVPLTTEQRRGLLELLSAERKERRALWREARETMDVKSSREKTQALREQTDESAAGILGSEAFDAWRQMRQEGRRWRR